MICRDATMSKSIIKTIIKILRIRSRYDDDNNNNINNEDRIPKRNNNNNDDNVI